MKSTDRMILISLAGIGLLAAFWLMVVSPKREELSELSATAGELRASVSALDAEAAAGQAAREQFPKHYSRMVVLGKAVPSAHEEADLIVGLDRIGEAADVSFRTIELNDGLLSAAPPQPVTAETQTDDNQQAATTAAATATPTEAVASTLPLGASIGPAGLGVMGWNVQFVGDFFDINSVLAAIDRSVRFEGAQSRARGRLVTVDGFSLSRADSDQVPDLVANLAIRSYLTPENEGIVLGATAAGPAGVPVSAEVAP